MECLNMSGYFQRLKRHLDCPKPLRSSFVTQTRRMAEDFVQGRPDVTPQEVADFLGNPEELAQGFLETLEPAVLKNYRKRKKFLLFGCIAALAVLLVAVSVWCIYLWREPMNLEVTETVIIYPEFEVES